MPCLHSVCLIIGTILTYQLKTNLGASISLLLWWSHREQAGGQMGFGNRCCVFPDPGIFILLQQQVRNTMGVSASPIFSRSQILTMALVSHLWRLLLRDRHRMLVYRGVRSHHDACANAVPWKVSGFLDCVAKPRTASRRCNQVSLRPLQRFPSLGFPPANFGLHSLSKNHQKGVEGGVTPDTYVAFLIIECIAYVTGPSHLGTKKRPI